MLDLTVLPLAAQTRVVANSSEVAVMRLVSRAWRDAVDEAGRSLWLSLRSDDGPRRSVSSLLSLVAKCKNVEEVDLFFDADTPLVELAPMLASLWRLPKLRVGPQARSGLAGCAICLSRAVPLLCCAGPVYPLLLPGPP
jgi:hypothetical protein